MTSKPTAVHVSHLSKSFNLPRDRHSTLKSLLINPFHRRGKAERQQVIKDISFEIKQGEFLGIVGRNGGGKSTLLKLLASIYAPDKGTIGIHGKLVPFIELGVGFNPELSGRDNVYLNGALLGLSDAEIDKIYDDIVAFAELEKFMSQKLKNYSSGMQVRLAFSLATRVDADILLVDEVLAVGDLAFQRKCYDYFASLKNQQKTVIFISHDMNAVREYCTRAILIDEGKIVATDSADKIAEKYIRLFSGKPDDHQYGEETRWGDGTLHMAAKILSSTDDAIKVEVQLKANKDVRDCVTGVSIHAADGEVICGTNTELLRDKLPDLKTGETITLHWEIPNIFRDGRYSIGLSAHGYGGLPVYDWWNDALHFDVTANRRSPYAVSPKIELDISR